MTIRKIFAMFLAMSLALLPTLASAAMSDAPPAAQSPCHDAAGDERDTNDGVQSCADHCLSQVNASARFERLAPPSINNCIGAPLGIAIDSKRPRPDDPPENPPPRV